MMVLEIYKTKPNPLVKERFQKTFESPNHFISRSFRFVFIAVKHAGRSVFAPITSAVHSCGAAVLLLET